MRLSATAALAACCASAHAFSDSTPFVLFSTSKLAVPSGYEQLQSSTKVASSARELLASCPTDRYLLVSQTNLNTAHLSQRDAVSNLRHSLDNARSSYSVAEVAGDVDLKQLSDFIKEACNGKTPSVDELDLEPLSAAVDVATLKENDDKLGLILSQYETEGSYTVIYTGGPRTEQPETYTAQFLSGMHTELKRQVQNVGRRAINGSSDLPLFEKYQYFSPGIFMSLLVLIVLLSILYAGISAISSLEVSYGAFDKDMGPAAQKKQQ